MIAAPGVEIAEVHSCNVVESGDELSVWLLLSDGSLVAVHLPVAELLKRAVVIEAATPRAALALVSSPNADLQC